MSAIAHHHSHHAHHHTHGWVADRVLTWAGTFLLAVPLAAGLVAATMALTTNRLGGPGNALTALWYPALVASPAALVGAVLLLVALRAHWQRRRPAIIWSVVMVAGLTAALALPVLTGMATDTDALSGASATAFFTADTIVIVAYLIAVMGLVVTGVRHLREHDRRRVG